MIKVSPEVSCKYGLFFNMPELLIKLMLIGLAVYFLHILFQSCLATLDRDLKAGTVKSNLHE